MPTGLLAFNADDDNAFQLGSHLAPDAPKPDSDDNLGDKHRRSHSSSSSGNGDHRSNSQSSDLASSPGPGLPPTPSRLDDGQKLKRHSPPHCQTACQSPPNLPSAQCQFALDTQPNSFQNLSCSTTGSVTQLVAGLLHPPGSFGFQHVAQPLSISDQATDGFQPLAHCGLSVQGQQSHRILHPQVTKPLVHQVLLDHASDSTEAWTTNHSLGNLSHFTSLQDTTGRLNPKFPQPCSVNGDPEDHETDPFALLSAHSLALMEQPESEVTIYDCEYCEKTYQGKHARSIWRRHLSDKHQIPLATQPRRTRWDNDANRPKTEEERRERTLESKRRWARKNRAAKKAARESQRNGFEPAASVNHMETLTHSHRSTPDRSQAPSPSLYPMPVNNISTHPHEYSTSGDQISRSHSFQVGVSGLCSSAPNMSRGSSAPHVYSPYASMPLRASGHETQPSYNPSFVMPPSTSEWSFEFPFSPNPASYSLSNCTSIQPELQSSMQFPARLMGDGVHPGYEPTMSQDLYRRHSLQTPRSVPSAQQNQFSQSPLTAECFPHVREQISQQPFASFGSQYASWNLGGRLGLGAGLAPSIEEPNSSYEPDAKRPRLTHQPFSIPLEAAPPGGHQNAQQYPSLEMGCNGLEIHDESRSSASSRCGIPSEGLTRLVLKESPTVSTEEEVKSEQSGACGEGEKANSATETSADEKHEGQEQKLSRPVTAVSLPLGKEHGQTNLVERAATEPQLSIRHEPQTPLRPTGFRPSVRAHFGHSPLYGITPSQARALDPVDLFSSPVGTATDATLSSLYHGHFAPMSAHKRRPLEAPQATPGSSASGINDWTHQVLQTPSGFSRFPFGGEMMTSSPTTGGALFSSPHHSSLSKSLGLAPNGGTVGEDCLGGLLLGTGSSWDMVHQRY